MIFGWPTFKICVTPPFSIVKFALIWFSGFRGEDLNVIFYQNMSNLYNRYKLVERKFSQKKTEYMGQPRENPGIIEMGPRASSA
jgi:hypothetical protein